MINGARSGRTLLHRVTTELRGQEAEHRIKVDVTAAFVLAPTAV